MLHRVRAASMAIGRVCLACLVLAVSGISLLGQQKPDAAPSAAEVSGTYSFLRDGEFVQVTVEEANATDATRYCAVVKSGVPISWTDFKSYCWETPATRSTSAVGKSIVNASLTIPGTTVPNDFDLCLQSVTLQ